MRNRVRVIGTAVTTGTAVIALAGSAWAAPVGAPPPAVAAAVTGFVSTVPNTACTSATPSELNTELGTSLPSGATLEQAQFSQVEITGTFVDGQAQPFVGLVSLPTGITACVGVVVGAPNPQDPSNPIPVVATGNLKPTNYNGTGVGALAGTVNDGGFVQAGTKAEALIDLQFDVNGTNPSSQPVMDAIADITVAVQPNVGQCAAGATICESADGPVVGSGVDAD